MAYLLQDNNDLMGDWTYDDALEMEIEPLAQSQKGKARQQDFEPTSSRDKRTKNRDCHHLTRWKLTAESTDRLQG